MYGENAYGFAADDLPIGRSDALIKEALRRLAFAQQILLTNTGFEKYRKRRKGNAIREIKAALAAIEELDNGELDELGKDDR